MWDETELNNFPNFPEKEKKKKEWEKNKKQEEPAARMLGPLKISLQ